MKPSFKDYINHVNEDDLTGDEFMKDIEKSFKSKFPNGYIKVSDTQAFSNKGDNYFITFGLIANIQDVSYSIRQNDPLSGFFTVYPDPKGWVISKENSSISVNPPKDSYLAMGSVKIPFRKAKGNFYKIVSVFDKQITKTKKVVTDNEANIYDRANIKDKYFK